MSGFNLPAGVMPSDIDALSCGGPREDFPIREDCFLCACSIQRDADTGRWYFEDDVAALGMNYMLGYSDALDAFETQRGWCCSQACWDDHQDDCELGGAA